MPDTADPDPHLRLLLRFSAAGLECQLELELDSGLCELVGIGSITLALVTARSLFANPNTQAGTSC